MTQSEADELRKQLVETVKQYEGKLATLSVFNDALQSENLQLREEVEESRTPRSTTEAEVQELKQEFTRRMAAADKDNARLKEKNEQPRNKLNAVNQGGSNTQARLRDREDYITSLQSEGEVLARRNGELESTARKLRSSLKEAEGERERLQSRLRQQDELLSRERERYEMAVEASARQVSELQTSYDTLQQRAQEQISSALAEGAAAARLATEQAERGGHSALQAALDRQADLGASIDDLRAEHELAELSWSKREEALRREVIDLEGKIRQQESDAAEALAMASEGTRPLLRQIESMAAAAKSQERVQAEAERRLQEKLQAALEAQQAALDSENTLKSRLRQVQSGQENAQRAAESATRAATEARRDTDRERGRADVLNARLAEATATVDSLGSLLANEKAKHESSRQELQERVWEAQEEVQRLSSQLEDFRQARQQNHLTAPPKRFSRPASASSLHSDSHVAALPVSTSSHVLESQQLLTRSPIAHDGSSGNELAGGGLVDDFDRLFRSSGAERSGELSVSNGHAPGSTMSEARLASLQSRLAAAESGVERANEELLKACKRAEAAQADASRLHATLQELQTLQARHDMALELLGERNERVETLEDDICEMKHIFHTQLSALVDELGSLKGLK